MVFPGGAGTAEEILYLLGILLDPANRDQPLPVVLTGPAESAGYFEHMSRFIAGTLGEQALKRLHVIVDDPADVGAPHGATAWKRCASSAASRAIRTTSTGCCRCRMTSSSRSKSRTSRCARCELHRDQPAHELAANLRRAFSGIVTGNVKEYGIQAIEKLGPYEFTATRRS